MFTICYIIVHVLVNEGEMLARIAFYPSLAYNLLVDKLTSRQWYSRIDNTVILGALPFRSMTKQLKEKENVKAVVTLNEEYETKHFVNSFEEWRKVGIEQLRLDTVDLVAAPSQENLTKGVDFIMKYRETGGSVYVHCKAGKTRSTSLVACYLIKLHGWTTDEAVEFIKEKRSHIWLRPTQMKAICDYEKRVT